MPSFKLVYFPARARAEIIRLLFAQAGVEYEDVRLEFPAFQKDYKHGRLSLFLYFMYYFSTFYIPFCGGWGGWGDVGLMLMYMFIYNEQNFKLTTNYE